jgi:hypothetical protein
MNTVNPVIGWQSIPSLVYDTWCIRNRTASGAMTDAAVFVTNLALRGLSVHSVEVKQENDGRYLATVKYREPT